MGSAFHFIMAYGGGGKAVETMFSSGDYCDLMYMSHGLSYKGGDEAAVKCRSVQGSYGYG